MPFAELHLHLPFHRRTFLYLPEHMPQRFQLSRPLVSGLLFLLTWMFHIQHTVRVLVAHAAINTVLRSLTSPIPFYPCIHPSTIIINRVQGSIELTCFPYFSTLHHGLRLMGRLVSLSSFHFNSMSALRVPCWPRRSSVPQYRLLSNLQTLYLRSPWPLSNGMTLPQ